MSYFLKSIFLLFYNISNICNNIFLFPILIEYFLQFNIKINWINIGLIYSFYQFGSLLGNLLWNKFTYKFSSAILLLISINLIITLNIILIYINNLKILLIQRFLLGLLNNLPFIQKNIYLELNKQKNEFFLINILSHIISIIISVIDFKKFFNFKIEFNNNKFFINIIFLLATNIILLLLTLLAIKNKYIKISKKYYKINSPKLSVSNKIKKNENIKENIIKLKNINNEIKKNNKKKNNIFQLREDTDLSREKSNRKFNHFNNNNNDKTETNNNMGKSINNLGDDTDNDEKNKNEIIDYEFNNNKNLENNFNLELKLSLIHSLLNLLDYLFFIWIFIIFYIKYFNFSIKIGINFLLLNLFFLCLKFPLTTKIFSILKKYDKNNFGKISKIFIYIEIIIIIFINLDIIFYYFNILEFENLKIFFLYFLIVIRNLTNSGIIQIYNIYIAIEYNYNAKKSRILIKYDKYGNSILKTIFSFFSAYGYYLIENTKNIDINLNNLYLKFVLFFLLFPILILITTLILVNNYLI